MAGFPSSLSFEIGDWSASTPPPQPGLQNDPAAMEESQAIASALTGAGLVKMVESEIIPRLMLAHRTAGEQAPPLEAPFPLGSDTTDAFARMVLAKEPPSLLAFVGKLLQGGLSMESIYVELLAPAARRLGDYWDDDTASFTDVTIGLGRLQQVVRALGWRAPSNGEDDRFSRSVLFAPSPGEQHTFGLFIIEDFFRRSGWRTWLETSFTENDISATVGSHWFDVFGMSAAHDTQIDRIASGIRLIRRASRNRDLFVLVGGRLFTDQPELVARVGADGTAAGGGEALLVANEALLIADGAVRRIASGT